MSQQDTDFPIDPTAVSGTELATILNEMNDALLTMRSGATEPATAQAGTAWLDTSATDYHYIKFYNGSFYSTMFRLDVATGKLSVYSQDGGNIIGELDVNGNMGIYTTLGQSRELNIYNDSGGLEMKVEISGSAKIGQVNSLGVFQKAWARMYGDGGVELYHNDVKKIETTVSGCTAIGALTSDTLHAGDGASGTFSNPTSITVVDGIITAIS